MNTSADPAVQASIDAAASAEAEAMGMTVEEMQEMEASGAEMPSMDEDDAHPPESEGNGLESSLAGLQLDNVETTATSEAPGKLSLRIELDNGATAQGFAKIQSKPMHLYVLSKDLSTYVHTHPARDSEGTWTADVPPLPGGPTRVVSVFRTSNIDGEEHQLTLGTDITVEGTPSKVALPAPTPTVKVDGYTVTLGDGLAAGVAAELQFTATKGGKPAALEPYLESWAHTSAFAADTLAQSHLHPAQEWQEGAESPQALTFAWTPDAPGTYRIFIEFMADGELHRADFTRSVAG